MAKQRYIDTHFWDDSFIESIRPYERYLFMYFLTNPHTNICGVYELSLRKIASETALTEDRVREIMKQFEEAGKIYYLDGWVFVKNFIRHQAINPKIKAGIANKVKELPKKILEKIADIEPTHSLLIDTELLEPELESKSKPELRLKEKAPTPKTLAQKFFESDAMDALVVDTLVSKGVPREYASSEIKNFKGYWKESSTDGRKQRWQGQRFFDLHRRLATWFSRSREFKKSQDSQVAKV